MLVSSSAKTHPSTPSKPAHVPSASGFPPAAEGGAVKPEASDGESDEGEEEAINPCGKGEGAHDNEVAQPIAVIVLTNRLDDRGRLFVGPVVRVMCYGKLGGLGGGKGLGADQKKKASDLIETRD